MLYHSKIAKLSLMSKIVSSTENVDSIIEYILDDNPDFNDLDYLTKKLEGETLDFIRDI